MLGTAIKKFDLSSSPDIPIGNLNKKIFIMAHQLELTFSLHSCPYFVYRLHHSSPLRAQSPSSAPQIQYGLCVWFQASAAK